MDWNSIWSTITNFFATNGMRIIWAILVVIIGFIVVKILMKLIRSWLKRAKVNPTLQGFINSIIKVVLYVVLIMIIMQIWGIPITTLATVLATAGVAISLALKDSLSNVAYGMILIATRPFDQGQYVQIGNVEGTVKAIDIMSTQIVTVDNKVITIPNQIVYSNEMINYTTQGTRRIDVYFDVAYETDIDKLREIAMKICHSNGKILLDPIPELHVHAFGDSNIKIFLKCWAKGPYWDAYYYVMDNLFNELARNGIKVNYQQVEVRTHEDKDRAPIPFNKKALPKRVEEVVVNTDDFNLFDIDSYADLQHKIKTKKMERLKKKKEKLSTEINEIASTLPSGKIDILIKTKSIMLKKKVHLKRGKLAIKLNCATAVKKEINAKKRKKK